MKSLTKYSIRLKKLKKTKKLRRKLASAQAQNKLSLCCRNSVSFYSKKWIKNKESHINKLFSKEFNNPLVPKLNNFLDI